MQKRSDNTIFDFAETIKEKYPHLTPDQIYAICRSPFKLVASQMKAGTLTDIRIKYLGSFCVFPGRVTGLLNVMKKKFSEGKITKDYLDQYQTFSDNYFKIHTHEQDSLDQTTDI